MHSLLDDDNDDMMY